MISILRHGISLYDHIYYLRTRLGQLERPQVDIGRGRGVLSEHVQQAFAEATLGDWRHEQGAGS